VLSRDSPAEQPHLCAWPRDAGRRDWRGAWSSAHGACFAKAPLRIPSTDADPGSEMRPQSDDYPDYIERAVRTLVDSGVAAGAAELEAIKYPPRPFAPRRNPSRALRCKVFWRDGFRCRYCGGKTILEPLMALLGLIYPDLFPWHPNWRGGLTHPAVVSRSAIVDHVEPVAQGGQGLVLKNLVTACNPCNSIKSDFSLEQLGWELQPITRDAGTDLPASTLACGELPGNPILSITEVGWPNWDSCRPRRVETNRLGSRL
jgi:HNH endonuclease